MYGFHDIGFTLCVVAIQDVDSAPEDDSLVCIISKSFQFKYLQLHSLLPGLLDGPRPLWCFDAISRAQFLASPVFRFPIDEDGVLLNIESGFSA